MFYRDTWAEVDIDQLKKNIQIITKHTKKAFFAVIKANGYGLGDKMMALAAIDAGSSYLAVSSLDEAIALRLKNIPGPILVLGYTDPQYCSMAIEHDITLNATSLSWIKSIADLNLLGLKLHLKIDTGMNRLGIKTQEEALQAIEILKTTHCITEGIFTHFSCSDVEDNLMCNQQMHQFKQIVNTCNYPFRWIHCCNSDASMHYQDDFSNAVRCGIAMLGICSYKSDLKPVFSLYSKLVHVKKCEQGEVVGYGATYTTQQNEWIGTLSIGYADGWIRKNQGRNCLINQEPCEFIGRICMDQCMIRLPREYSVGTVIELVGKNIPIQEVAKELDTIPYEIVTLLSDRVAKVYIEHGNRTQSINPRLER